MPVLPRWFVVVIGASLIACSGGPPEREAPRIDLLERRGLRIAPETRRLELGRGDRGALIRGWLGNEWNPMLDLHFVWATGRESVVAFDLLQPVEQQFLVKLSPFPTNRPQRIDVLINDRPVSEILPAPGYREYRFVAPEATLRTGRNLLTFRHAEIGPPPRLPAASYASILHGPNCLRLRPKGRAPAPPGVARADGALLVRGPTALSWQLRPPGDSGLGLTIEPTDEPFTLIVDAIEGREQTRLGEARVAPRWLSRGTRDFRFDLSKWRGRRIRVRLQVLPETCGSAYATARIVQAGVFLAG